MENPIKMDDLGVPLFLETPIFFSASKKLHPRLAWSSRSTRRRVSQDVSPERNELSSSESSFRNLASPNEVIRKHIKLLLSVRQ